MAADNLAKLFKEHKAHPLKSFIPLLVNAPIFISFFMALRKMAELPVRREGGEKYVEERVRDETVTKGGNERVGEGNRLSLSLVPLL